MILVRWRTWSMGLWAKQAWLRPFVQSLTWVWPIRVVMCCDPIQEVGLGRGSWGQDLLVSERERFCADQMSAATSGTTEST